MASPAEQRGVLTVVVADDESLARRKLTDYLASVEWTHCVGEARSGPEAVAMVNRLRPDLLFLDIRMPGLSGFEVLTQLEHEPAIIFTTAYDQYAVTAFEVRALDYLVKPFGRTRFLDAVSRVRDSSGAVAPASLHARARDAMRGELPLRQLFIRGPRGIHAVDVSAISRFEAADDYVTVHSSGKPLLAAIRMDELETLLDRNRFLRIHRSHIVNLAAVQSMEPHESGRLQVTMHDGTVIFASRLRSRDLRRRAF